MASQNKALASGQRVNLSSLESAIMKSLGAIDKKIASNKALMGVAASQKRTNAEIEALKAQSKEIKTLETQQIDYISVKCLISIIGVNFGRI